MSELRKGLYLNGLFYIQDKKGLYLSDWNEENVISISKLRGHMLPLVAV